MNQESKSSERKLKLTDERKTKKKKRELNAEKTMF